MSCPPKTLECYRSLLGYAFPGYPSVGVKFIGEVESDSPSRSTALFLQGFPLDASSTPLFREMLSPCTPLASQPDRGYAFDSGAEGQWCRPLGYQRPPSLGRMANHVNSIQQIYNRPDDRCSSATRESPNEIVSPVGDFLVSRF